MLLNYLNAAWRSLRKAPLYSAINIGGLSAGLAVCMLILVYVVHEHSYDGFHKNADRIFRVHSAVHWGTQSVNIQSLSADAGPMIRATDPRVESFLRVEDQDQNAHLQNKGRPDLRFTEKKFLFADSNFFSFFSFPLRSGRAETVLQRPFSVVLSERAARKYFGTTDPVGQLLVLDHQYTLEVTGVAKNPPSNSSIDFDFITPVSTLGGMAERKEELAGTGMAWGTFVTYLRLNRREGARGVEKTLAALDRGDSPSTYYLDLFRDSHLGLNFGDFSNIKYLRIFPLIAGLVLLLALINYMSLATARATTRAKEIGVRRTLGAGRRTLAFQFYTESALYAGLAFLLGYALFVLFRPGFLNLLALSIDDGFLANPRVIGLFAGLLVFTILAAGSYPAVVLSSFRPIAILSGKVSRNKGGAGVRRLFTVLQFTISIALIGCSLVMYQQLSYLRHKDTGVNRENILEIPYTEDMGRHYDAFRSEVASLPGVVEVATTHTPIYSGSWEMGFVDGESKKQPLPLPMLNASPNFLSLAGIRWKYPPADAAVLQSPSNIVLNEQALSDLKLPLRPIGQTLSIDGKRYTVAGVVRDFNYTSLDYPMSGLGIVRDTANEQNRPNKGCLYVKVSAHINLPTLVEAIGKACARYDPGSAFSYQFMDEAFNAQYKAEDRLAGLLGVFTLLTIGIACLGLFGLATFSTIQRTKEIGIRKVLGAGVPGIIRLLTTDFLWLVGLSIVLASPLAWWAMHRWLEGFAYRIAVSPVALAAAGLGAALIALLTVGGQALRAARANPVKSLRSE